MLPVKYSTRQLQTQLTNAQIHIHDLACGCGDPLKHLLQLLTTEKIETTLKQDTIKQIKCLLDGDHGDTDGDHKTGDTAVDELFEGELDQLFGQPFEDDDG